MNRASDPVMSLDAEMAHPQRGRVLGTDRLPRRKGDTGELYRRVLLGEEYAQRTLRHLIDNNDPRIPADALCGNGPPTGVPAGPSPLNATSPESDR